MAQTIHLLLVTVAFNLTGSHGDLDWKPVTVFFMLSPLSFMSDSFTPALIAFGSNEGDSQTIFKVAVQRISDLVDVHLVGVSEPISTKPVKGAKTGPNSGADELETVEPDYLNAVIRVKVDQRVSQKSPQWLLEKLLAIEKEFGRIRKERWAQRTIDLDLLLFGQDVVSEPGVEIPHPRMSFRRFVLEPANEIAPELVHPVTDCSLRQLLERLNLEASKVAMLLPSNEEFAIEDAKVLAKHEIQKIFFDAKILAKKISDSPENRTEFYELFGIEKRCSFESTKLLIVASQLSMLEWSSIPNRFAGPTLLLDPSSPNFQTEIRAALEAI